MMQSRAKVERMTGKPPPTHTHTDLFCYDCEDLVRP